MTDAERQERQRRWAWVYLAQSYQLGHWVSAGRMLDEIRTFDMRTGDFRYLSDVEMRSLLDHLPLNEWIFRGCLAMHLRLRERRRGQSPEAVPWRRFGF